MDEKPEMEVSMADESSPSSSNDDLSNDSQTLPFKDESMDRVLLEVPTDGIEPNPYQPRKVVDPDAVRELANSIEAEGLLQPIVVRRVGNSYQLIAGERRWRAHQALGRKKILARILDVGEVSSDSLSLIENLQREDLNPIEEAEGYESLVKDFNLTQEKVAERVGKSRSYVANSIRLLQLNQEIRDLLSSSALSIGVAKVLLGVEDHKEQTKFARFAAKEHWTVRQCEDAIVNLRSGTIENIRKNKKDETEFKEFSRSLESTLSRTVRIKSNPDGTGELTLGFSNRADLDGLLAYLKRYANRVAFLSNEWHGNSNFSL
mgnify:CR=1 FL=1